MIFAAIIALLWLSPLTAGLLIAFICLVSAPARRWTLRQLIGEQGIDRHPLSLGER